MEEFEYSGIWWLPENPENQVSGTLKYNPRDGATLILVGSFKEEKNFNIFIQPKMILGVTSNGKYITLYKCFETKFNMSFPGLLNSAFKVSVIIIGCHFGKEEDIVFSSLSLSYSNLNEWTGISGFRLKPKFNQENRLIKFEVLYEFPEKIEAKFDKYNISIDFNFNTKRENGYELNLKQTTVFKIEPNNPFHLNEYLDEHLYNIQNFLSLAIGTAAYPLIIIGKSKASITKLNDGTIVYNDILIFYKLGTLVDLSKKVYEFDMLFSFKDISDNFEIILKNWIEKSEILRPVYDLYFGTLYNPSMYLQHQFLSLVQALESYHRRKYEGKYISDNNYSELHEILVKSIPKNVESDFRKSLYQKIKYLNEFSLRKRIKEIFLKYGDLVESIIQDQENFIEDIVNTRNFLTHYDKDLEPKSKKGKELYWLTQKMKFLLEICLLSELGIHDESIKTLVSRNQKFQNLAKH